MTTDTIHVGSDTLEAWAMKVEAAARTERILYCEEQLEKYKLALGPDREEMSPEEVEQFFDVIQTRWNRDFPHLGNLLG